MVLLAVFLLVSPAMAAKKHKKAVEKTAESAVAAEQVFNPHCVIQLQGGPGLVLSSTPNGSATQTVTFENPGWGYNISVGYAVSKEFSLALLTGYQVSGITAQGMPSTISAGIAYVPVQLVPQYYFSTGDTRFYGLLGIGLAANGFYETVTVKDMPKPGLTASEASVIQETDFLLSPGVGAAFKLCDKADLFVQAKLDIDFFSQTFADFLSSIGGGNKFDGTQMYLPIQVGVNYSIY